MFSLYSTRPKPHFSFISFKKHFEQFQESKTSFCCLILFAREILNKQLAEKVTLYIFLEQYFSKLTHKQHEHAKQIQEQKKIQAFGIFNLRFQSQALSKIDTLQSSNFRK